MSLSDDWFSDLYGLAGELADDILGIELPELDDLDDDSFNPSDDWYGWEDWMADALWNFIDYLDNDAGYFG